ncbi:MAG: excinuclease ABC subunit UvrA [Candidatus Aminicenantes bacterium]|nr:MAG: excinuclease ABC subunit UvrA [Candidatus Aminicenantes bacterium]
MDNTIILRGVRVHNLKNINLDIPLNKLIIVTGVSGSGKSSLAFDTLYAEGQRRYIESLSSYARQFLERMEKPDADLIEGITPAIAIQQKAVTKNPRSTVATVTEVYDFLRVLFARIGTVHCLQCGEPVKRDTIDAVVDRLYNLPLQTKIQISFSWPSEKGLGPLKKGGFFRVVQEKKVRHVDEVKLDKTEKIDVLVDQMTLNKEDRERLVDSLEIGLREGNGKIKVRTDSDKEFVFSDRLECKVCEILYEEPFPNLFSFNSPQGACPVCHGFGDLAVLDEDKIIPDKNKSLEEGAVEPWTKPVSRRLMRKLIAEAQSRGIPTDIPYREMKDEWKKFVFEGEGRYRGVKGFFERLQRKKYKVQVRVFLSRYRKYIPCPDCQQMRLNPQALNVKVKGLSIGQVTQMTVQKAFGFFNTLKLTPFQKQVAEKLIEEIQNRLKFLLEVGLDYITLDRMTFTLSGGEAQRINLAAALSASLVGTLFVLDEPSIGLHARDNQRLVEILKSLKDIGNTVMVVEHDPEIIKSAEYTIDLGPRAGEAGGKVIYDGPLDKFLTSHESLTAQYLRSEKRIKIPETRRTSADFIEIKDAEKHNLKHLDVKIPLNIFTCTTGVSGSGKSTLLYDVLFQGWRGEARDGFSEIKGKGQIDKIIMVDQSPISTSPRSIPATYTKAMDEIRAVFSQTREAKALGMKPGFFSFNTPGGRCEDCKGAGHLIVEMQFLSDVVLTCEACKGKRFKSEILEIKYKGKTIDQVLQMSVSEAYEFFSKHPKIRKKLTPLTEVGLGYLKLGQPTTTLSGGELQRIKLAHHLIHQRDKRILYLFDEPTIGLHPDDVSVLLNSFQKLVDEGHTVVVIEHNLDMIKCADHVIDLGPEGGERGGRIVAQGPPEEIVKSKKSHTGLYLKKYLAQ